MTQKDDVKKVQEVADSLSAAKGRESEEGRIQPASKEPAYQEEPTPAKVDPGPLYDQKVREAVTRQQHIAVEEETVYKATAGGHEAHSVQDLINENTRLREAFRDYIVNNPGKWPARLEDILETVGLHTKSETEFDPYEYMREYNAVEPPHYRRGPVLKLDIGAQITTGISQFDYVLQCIDVMREMKDPRLATAFKYIWRVAFGGKQDPNYLGTQEEIDARDIASAVWYLQDYLDKPATQ